MNGVERFFDISLWHAVDVIFLGFVGGVLSGFMGTGGAFIMTPGMMNLGVPGVIAVGSNLTHKFGKSVMNARRHAELGHVDIKLGLVKMGPALLGVWLAAWLNSYLFKSGGGETTEAGGAVGDLFISVMFVVVLSVISIAMLVDVKRFDRRITSIGTGPSLAERIGRIRIPPMIHFPVADVTLSFWLVGAIGMMTGFLAGAIGVGGFLGVPAMIYLLGVPTAVAAGTEIFLAIFMGAFGALAYAWNGYIDLRLVFLLYLGSLAGIYLGAYGTKVVKEKLIRLITGMVILVSVFSRMASIPVYLDKLDYIALSSGMVDVLNIVSRIFLFAGGTGGVLYILFYVLRAYRRRRRVRRLLEGRRAGGGGQRFSGEGSEL